MPTTENKPQRIPERISATLVITCYCGLARLTDPGHFVGDRITLDPCPKCGAAFSGILVDPHHIEVDV